MAHLVSDLRLGTRVAASSISSFGWLQILAQDAPPTGSALAEVLPDDLVAERP